jgi:hypothetical protein
MKQPLFNWGKKIHPGLKLRVSGVKKMMRVDC